MDTHARINALIDLALARGDRTALLILQGRRRRLMAQLAAERINRNHRGQPL